MEYRNTVPRWLITVMVLAMLFLLAGGAWFYRTQKQQLRQQVEANLQAIAQLKVDQITAWRADQIAEGVELTKSTFFTEGVAHWMANPNTDKAEEILARFRSLQEHYDYCDVLLVDAGGQVRLSLSGHLNSLHEEAARILSNTFQERRPLLTNLHAREEDQTPHLDVIAPLFIEKDQTPKPIGAVILQSDAQHFLFPLVQSWPTPSRTAKTSIIRQEGDSVLFLSNLRFQKNTALTLRLPMTQEDLTSVMAVKGLEGIVRGRDHRGIEVISALKHIPDSPWYMVAEVDASEAFASWRFRSILILALILGLIIITITTIGMVWQRNSKAQYQALFQAEAAQRESESRYHRILEDMLEGCQIIGHDWRYLYVNDACTKHSHRTKEELQGHTMMEVYPGIETTDMFAALQRCMNERTPQHLENEFTYPDGTTAWFELSIQPAPEGIFVLSIDISTRKRAEDSLRKSEERFSQITESTGEWIWETDTNGLYTYASPAIENILGYRPEEIVGKKHFYDLFLPNEREELKKLALEAFAKKESFHHLVNSNVHKNGKVVLLETSGVPILDDTGNLLGYRGADADITERKRAEEQLRTSEAQLSNAMKIARLGYWEYDVAKDLFTFNDHFYAIFRTTAEQVGGYTLSSARYAELFVHPDDASVVGIEVQKAIESPDPNYSRQLEHRVIFADGEIGYIAVRFFIVKDDQGRTVKTYGANQDITEQKRAEEALRTSEAQLSNAMKIAKLGYWELDIAKNLFTFNDHFYAIFRTTAEKVGGYTMSPTRYAELFVHPDDLSVVVTETRKAIETTDPHFSRQLEHRIIYADGEIGYIAVRFFIVKDEQGRTVKTYGANQDITERKRAEVEKEKLQGQLLQAQKMESVGRLAGGVAHDFNNMLGVIIGHTEMAKIQLDPDEPIQNDLQEILDAAQRSSELTRQLLAFARKQIVIPKILDLNDTVQGMLKMLRRLIGEDIDLVWVPGNDLWNVNMDPSQIDQLLANLMINARDAIDGAGKITIETENALIDETYCTNHTGFLPGDYIRLAVSDNGCGMDKETLSNIFEPFFTTKGVGEGTGLGLATVYGIVKQNEGFINAYSEPRQGTTFKVYLPRYKGDVATAMMAPEDEQPIGKKEMVLLVEDEMMILKLTTRMLEKLGYTILSTNRPEEAIDLAREHAGDIQLLITDLVMPEMNGRELAEKLAAIKPGLRTLYMSGYTANVIAHHGVLEDDLQFIQKPFSIKELAWKVREALEKTGSN